MTPWKDQKDAIIIALEKHGYEKNKTVDTWRKPIDNSPMVCIVDLKLQPKPGEHIPVHLIDPDELNQPPTTQDINGTIGAAKQLIRNAKNKLEADQKEAAPDETAKPPEKQGITEQDIKPIKEVHTAPAVQLTGSVALTVEIVQQYVNPEATMEQAFNFIQLCEAHKLNPFIGEAHLIIYKGVAKMVVGVGGLMRRAQEEHDYNGYEAGIIILKEDGTIDERDGTFMLKDEKLVGGWCKAYRKGIDRPFVTKVSIDEYIQRKAGGEPNKVWSPNGMPATMICKVAKSQCHRDAYMGRNSGLYEQVEMVDLGDVEVIE